MKKEKKLSLLNKIPDIAVGLLILTVFFTWSLVQPIGSQPDELTRYMIPYYIFTNWKLPNGNLEELLVRGYGISYGFFPCLPYICMAPVMKLVSLFTENSFAILMGARAVNMAAGMITYVFVRRISRKLPLNAWTGWLFTLLICCWPQAMFIFTYTNCDAFAFMSVAIIVYAMISGLTDGWKLKNIICLSVGCSVCLLSYFNAYGMILGAAVTFTLSFIRPADDIACAIAGGTNEAADHNKNKVIFAWRDFLKNGIIIAAIVFVLAGWWFIRNAVLYDGDFIGMTANRICAEANAADYLKPSVRDTIKNNGGSIFDLLRDSSYMFLLKQSFFGRFGNMDLAAPNYVIRFFKLMLALGVIGLFIPNRDRLLKGCRRLAYDCGMAVGFITPVFLCFYYSYADDYQPQGRYMLPGLIPLFCLLVIGFYNLEAAGWLKVFEAKFKGKFETYWSFICRCLCICFYLYIVLTVAGDLVLILQNYLPGLSDTFGLVYTGNLYE